MKWVTVEDFHYNVDHIAEFQWSNGKLYVWDDIPIEADVVDNVCVFDDQDGMKYRSLCHQLEVNVAAVGLPEPPREMEETND